MTNGLLPAYGLLQAGDQGETEYPDLPDPLPPAPDRHAHPRVDWDLTAAWLDAEVVGRVYHKGSGDRHYSRLPTAPKFEGYSLEVRVCVFVWSGVKV